MHNHGWMILFRPNMQLQNFLRSLSAHPELTPQAVRAVEALRTNELQKKLNMAPLFLFFFWKIKLITGACPPFLLPCSVTLFSILYRRNFWNLHHDRYTTTNLWKVFIKVHKELDDRGGSGSSRFGSKSDYLLFYLYMYDNGQGIFLRYVSVWLCVPFFFLLLKTLA